MNRVKVDFSTTVKNGLIRANQSRADEQMFKGDEVEAYDPAEGMVFVGVVDHLSEDGRFAFLRMYWEDNVPVFNQPGVNLFVAAWSEAPVAVQRLFGTVQGAAEESFVQPPVRVGGAAQPVIGHQTPAHA